MSTERVFHPRRISGDTKALYIRRRGNIIVSDDGQYRLSAELTDPASRATDRDAAEARLRAAEVAYIQASNEQRFVEAALSLYSEEIAAHHTKTAMENNR